MASATPTMMSVGLLEPAACSISALVMRTVERADDSQRGMLRTVPKAYRSALYQGMKASLNSAPLPIGQDR
jgi:hypothetical protein